MKRRWAGRLHHCRELGQKRKEESRLPASEGQSIWANRCTQKPHRRLKAHFVEEVGRQPGGGRRCSQPVCACDSTNNVLFHVEGGGGLGERSPSLALPSCQTLYTKVEAEGCTHQWSNRSMGKHRPPPAGCPRTEVPAERTPRRAAADPAAFGSAMEEASERGGPAQQSGGEKAPWPRSAEQRLCLLRL